MGNGELTVPSPAQPRVQAINRRQMVLRPMEVEQLIAADHPARAIWQLVGQADLSRFYAEIKAVEGTAGREAVDPQLLISLWIYAYSEKISSAREIERRCQQWHPGFGWLTGLTVINHHTLSDFRTAHGVALNQLFVEVLGVLSQAGVVSLERVMHDGTKVKANAADNSFRREPSLRQHLEAARAHVERLEQEAAEDPEGTAQSRRQQQAQRRAAHQRQRRIEQALAALEQIRAGKDDPQQARASLSDPEARIMKQAQGAIGPAYNVQISTDAQERIIVGVGVSQAASDGAELSPAIDRIAANLEKVPQQLVVDEGFINQSNLVSMDQQQIDLIGPVPDSSARSQAGLKHRGVSPEFFPSVFVYEAARDCYHCPAGKTLNYESREKKGSTIRYRYRARPADCQACPFQSQCCPKSRKGRSLVRSEDAPAVGAFKVKMQTPHAREIYKQRAGIAEFPNAWIKEKIGLRQFRLRGLAKVTLEALWACLTYNIQQWIRLLWRPQWPLAQARAV